MQFYTGITSGYEQFDPKSWCYKIGHIFSEDFGL